jgi:hypothetical protein
MRHPPRTEQLAADAEIELDETDLEEIDASRLHPVPQATGRRRVDTLDEPLTDGQETTIRARRSVPPPLPPSVARASPDVRRSVPPPPSALAHRTLPPPPPRTSRPSLPPPTRVLARSGRGRERAPRARTGAPGAGEPI